MWIVFIDINTDFGRSFEAAKELGLRILYISSNAGTDLTGTKISTIVDRWAVVSKLNFDTVSTVVHNEIAGEEVAAFFALKDSLMPLVSKLSNRLSTSNAWTNGRTIWLTKNKLEMRDALRGTQYNPRYDSISVSGQRVNPLGEYPVIVKPLLGYASIGVEKVERFESFGSACDRSKSVLKSIEDSIPDLDHEHDYDANDLLLIEEYVRGPEYSVDVFANSNGIRCVGVSEKSEMQAPFFEEISYSMPAAISVDLRLVLENAAIEIMNALGLKSGAAHLEFRMDGQIPKILDIGLRMGGSGLTHDLVYNSTGVDLCKAVIAELCGMQSESLLTKTCEDMSLLYLVQVGAGGKVQSVPLVDVSTLPDSLRQHLVSYKIFVKVGQRISGYPNYGGLPGYVVFKIYGRDQAAYQMRDRILMAAQNYFRLECR
jgi:predicted ATP-grasp superfamily ATP-dependent carboligase